MKYTVVTTPLALRQLAEIWLDAADRQRVAEAYNRIESALRHNAHTMGREHPGGWRVIVHPPLVATFRVSEDDRLATIMAVFFRP
jgi:plasmid stabilization system protein ParE